MTEESKTGAEQAVRELHNFLSEHCRGNRHMWMHDFFGTEFEKGQDYALTGLAVIPNVRSALDTIDKGLGSELEHWHGIFESMKESKSRESQ